MTVGNGQKMNCELISTVNMKLKGEIVKLTEFLYVPQAVNNILIGPRLISKGATTEDTKDKMPINKNAINIILDARKGKK